MMGAHMQCILSLINHNLRIGVGGSLSTSHARAGGLMYVPICVANLIDKINVTASCYGTVCGVARRSHMHTAPLHAEKTRAGCMFPMYNDDVRQHLEKPSA